MNPHWAGRRLFTEISPSTRLVKNPGEVSDRAYRSDASPVTDSSFAAPSTANARAGSPSPFDSQRAHLFDPEHDTDCVSATAERGRQITKSDIEHLLIGTTHRVCSPEEAAELQSVMERMREAIV